MSIDKTLRVYAPVIYSTIYPKRYFFTAVAIFTLMLVALPGYAEKPEHVKQLLDTNKCPKCDLSQAKLSRKNLVRADLNDANLSSAELTSSPPYRGMGIPKNHFLDFLVFPFWDFGTCLAIFDPGSTP
ncbi:MAG: pentapeptide repeat-containing protein, partial [Spirirestis rafaelensis WJT71-NPBG6]|nr:pentapeptide repeat-containing protein [Spirirestis rafaelensis WJT71-NPBG6]